jgi:O-acetyl-ADP-ribose deacetylase
MQAEGVQENPIDQNGKAILVVSDNLGIIQRPLLHLENAGFALEIVPSGEQALERLREQPEIALLITDIMPYLGMHGFDLIEKVRQTPAIASLPILLLVSLPNEYTGLTPQELWQKQRPGIIEAGANEFLFKPFRPAELVRTIQKMLGITPAAPAREVVQGDLLDQNVEVIVNAWNRNIIPWWLLLPQGVSGAIKKRAGTQPFRELARHGPIPLGQAVLTSAGNLPFRGIIHVAGINMLWRASEFSICQSVRSAMAIVAYEAFTSVAFPLIGAGSGGFSEARVLEIILEELKKSDTLARVVVVQYRR